MSGLLFQLVPFLFLIALGLIAGSHTERKHLLDLRQREARNADILLTQLKSYPSAAPGSPPPRLIVAEVVVATDYLKSFLSNLRKIFGGELRSYHSLLVRARGEVTQRILEDARRQGFNGVCNLRLETADVGGNTTAKRAAMVAILGSATAYHVRREE